MEIGDSYIRNNYAKDFDLKPYIVVIERYIGEYIYVRKVMIFPSRNVVEHFTQKWSIEDFDVRFNKI